MGVGSAQPAPAGDPDEAPEAPAGQSGLVGADPGQVLVARERHCLEP
jgi:hypothetical protein